MLIRTKRSDCIDLILNIHLRTLCACACVRVSGGPDNQVHFEGYQVSNQCMALVRDECLLPCKDAPELGFAKESTPEQYVPDVFYKVSGPRMSLRSRGSSHIRISCQKVVILTLFLFSSSFHLKGQRQIWERCHIFSPAPPCGVPHHRREFFSLSRYFVFLSILFMTLRIAVTSKVGRVCSKAPTNDSVCCQVIYLLFFLLVTIIFFILTRKIKKIMNEQIRV